ncbi:Sensor histidine kinase RegB [Rosistilla carotiformis]|uniref:histidine kinase n=1 Tax=Rosistilla carotiformis TaxID=2528017 RepID=A0A518JUD6_9BACT|nr:HAMP domain-containing sensor histidine kinase [Rosistilla carotiformis]QDV69160.1 Sensor histidine kinase RegB [Rosistilla carotiformis]
MPFASLTRLFHPSVMLRAPLGTSTWLLQLRWFAVVGQLVTITAVARFFPIELPLEPLFTLIGFTAATNFAYTIWLGMHESAEPAVSDDALYRTEVASLLMTLDLLTLAAMLYYSGGVDNPFVFFFFVNLAVAGVVLRPVWAWVLTSMSIASFAFLTYFRTPIELLSIDSHAAGYLIREHGMLIAFSTCAAVVTYFVSRIAEELTVRQTQLRTALQQQARSQRLEALTTLAAGAAHELASPLSTIAIVVREMAHHAVELDVPEAVRQDLKLIDSEVNHCKAILSRMRNAAGDQAAEHWDRITLVDLVDTIVEGIRDPHRVEISDDVDRFDDYTLWIPMEAVAQAIRNLIGNALDASPPDASVLVEVSTEEEHFTLEVIDSGEGMPEEVAQRAVEPFFTTKQPGSGMGLGLFLTRNVITRLGGTLEFDTQIGRGTRVIVRLPRRQQLSVENRGDDASQITLNGLE